MTALLYLFSTILFIFGIKQMTSPRTAHMGNKLSSLGMLVAVIATLLGFDVLNIPSIVGALIIGSVIGTYIALTVQMTQMPQLIAILNGFGGIASVLVAASSLFLEKTALSDELWTISVVMTVVIGAVTFWGSGVAFLKLARILKRGFSNQTLFNTINILAILGMIIAGALAFVDPTNFTLYVIALIVCGSILGIFLVLPIGGADMPVVIALLNSYSGLATAMTGFVLNNVLLIITGALVGASGIILTQIMCKAMNRSLMNVILGKGVKKAKTGEVDDIYEGKIKEVAADDIALILESAQSVVIVPGYGMAVAQAQHTVKEVTDVLVGMDIEVRFAIHPVAGRMPGHMNVLLAEAGISYERLIEMENINGDFQNTDVVIVLGANDVTNPSAREDKDSPIYGMPILNVDQARTTIVIKRSLSPGFAGIPNPLFIKDNALMAFGDGKQMMQEIVKALEIL